MPRRLQLFAKVAAMSLMLVAAAGSTAQSPALFELSVADAPAENGKRLNMSLREVERAANHSVVVVTFTSGGSVSSSMFILKGMCGVARARGESFFTSTDEGGSPRSYRVTFPKGPKPEELSGPGKKVFALSDCERLGF